MKQIILTPQSILIIALLFLGVSGIGNVVHFFRFGESLQNTLHSHDVQTASIELLSTIKDAETGQRGYLLTGEPQYLTPYLDSKAKIDALYEHVVSLTQQNPTQHDILVQLKPLLDKKMKEMLTTIQLRQQNNLISALEIVRTDKGHLWMGQIRSLLSELMKEETRQLQIKDKLVRRQFEERLVTNFISLGVSVLLILWMYQVLKNENHERYKKQMELEASEKILLYRTTELATTNKELEAFCYSVSHDLRAPLRGIEGFSRIVVEKYGDRLDEEGRQYLERVRAGIKRMSQLIDDLLNLSRITRAPLQKANVDLAFLSKEIVLELDKINPLRKVTWVIPASLPAYGDIHLLKVALENMLNNAYKYSAYAKPSAIIEIGKKGDTYFVKDNGVGFDMTYKGKLFNAFQRLHTQKEFPGSGIGLATVQRVIHRHGGQIWAEADVNVGATFFFTLV